MGLQLQYLQFLLGVLPPPPARMCELGNQQIRPNVRQAHLTSAQTAKEFFEALGYTHVSIDLNGRDGALPLDLTVPITDPQLIGTFDVLTNSGTTEHVIDQYACFENIHRLLTPTGVSVHLSPLVGSWPGHGGIRYSFVFFDHLARACRYRLRVSDLITCDEDRELAGIVLEKRPTSTFTSRERFRAIMQHTLPRHMLE